MGARLPYDNLGQLRQRLIEANPVFAAVDQVESVPQGGFGTFGAPGALDPAPFAAAVENFYMTDPISRASETMAKCTEAFVLGRGGEATGTDG